MTTQPAPKPVTVAGVTLTTEQQIAITEAVLRAFLRIYYDEAAQASQSAGETGRETSANG